MPLPAVAALRQSHTTLAALVEPLTPDQLTGPSYDDDWSVADVLSHLGSGAVIGAHALDSALAGADVDPAHNQAVWDEWNAKDPQRQATDALAVDARLVEAWEAVDAERAAALRFPFGPMEIDGPTMVRVRLSEHALHTWDVAVVFDPNAVVEAAAVGEIIDGVGMIAGFAGRPDGGSDLVVETTGAERRLVLEVGDRITLRPAGPDDGPADLVLPAEAFVRLVYGRLDPAHTPAELETPEIDRLRTMFPGF